MIILDATTKSLEIKLAGAITTNQLPYTIHYIDTLDSDQSVSDIGSGDGTSNSTTAVTVLSAPGTGHTKEVKHLSVYNADTVAATLTVQVNNNGTARIIAKTTLDVGDTWEYND